MHTNSAPSPEWTEINIPANFPARLGRLWVKQAAQSEPILGVRIEPEDCNSEMFAHGGFLLAFADIALSVSILGVTLSMSADFMRAAPVGSWLEAHVEIRKRSRNLIFAELLGNVSGKDVLRVSGVFKPLDTVPQWHADIFGS
ncbi:MAG: PaaI family thioesterase [Sphingomonadaceae bacterium]